MRGDIYLPKFFDHTLLKPESTLEQVKQLCQEARLHNFFSVCIPPYYVKAAKEFLSSTEVQVCTVIGFPLGYNTTTVKAFEAAEAIVQGATEIDMVINISALKNQDYETVFTDIQNVVKAAKGCVVKVILETCLLTNEEKIKACELTKQAGADFVKTSTGFNKAGATVEDIKLMRQTVGPQFGVKASGGIRDKNMALQLIAAGANRLGASSSVEIVSGQTTTGNY